jgi:hypothetical protein
LSAGEIHGVWGENYAEDFLSVLETLRLLSIPGMEESIKAGLEAPLDETKGEIEW